MEPVNSIHRASHLIRYTHLYLDLTLEYTLARAVKSGTVNSVRSLQAHLL